MKTARKTSVKGVTKQPQSLQDIVLDGVHKALKDCFKNSFWVSDLVSDTIDSLMASPAFRTKIERLVTEELDSLVANPAQFRKAILNRLTGVSG